MNKDGEEFEKFREIAIRIVAYSRGIVADEYFSKDAQYSREINLVIQGMAAGYETAKAEAQVLVEALSYYASFQHIGNNKDGVWDDINGYYVYGKHARQALAAWEGK